MLACDEQRSSDAKYTSSEQRPSVAQNIRKGRRTEIEFLNGFVVNEGEKLRNSCPANDA
jgi:2-dehydropantoate 2-reductase